MLHLQIYNDITENPANLFRDQYTLWKRPVITSSDIIYIVLRPGSQSNVTKYAGFRVLVTVNRGQFFALFFVSESSVL